MLTDVGVADFSIVSAGDSTAVTVAGAGGEMIAGPDGGVPVAIAEYGGEDINYWSLSAAAAVGIMLPIVAFMMALQRHLVRGLALGAVKG